MIETKWFSGTDDLSDAHHIRRTVFINEQRVSEEEEMDGTDGGAIHLVAYDGGQPVATGRILLTEDGQYLIGRVATLKELRGKGYGGLIVRMLIRKAFSMGAQKQYIHAQISARPFYESLGFVAYGEPYDEAGIPHVSMYHDGDVSGGCS